MIIDLLSTPQLTSRTLTAHFSCCHVPPMRCWQNLLGFIYVGWEYLLQFSFECSCLLYATTVLSGRYTCKESRSSVLFNKEPCSRCGLSRSHIENKLRFLATISEHLDSEPAVYNSKVDLHMIKSCDHAYDAQSQRNTAFYVARLQTRFAKSRSTDALASTISQ